MTPNLPLQRFIVDLPVATARRALAVVHDKGIYADLNELVTVALENQLRLDSGPAEAGILVPPHRAPAPESQIPSEAARTLVRKTPVNASDGKAPARKVGTRKTSARKASASPKAPTGLKVPVESPERPRTPNPMFSALSDEMLLDIPGTATIEAPEPTPGSEALSAFTNRLSPFVIPIRVLTNAMTLSGPPSVEDFVQRTPGIARRVGQWLKQEDAQLGRRGRLRRSTAWPVGDDEKASISRFRKSFLVATESGRTTGPLLDLGFAVVENGRVVPTERAFQVATEKTPLLGEAEDGALFSTQQQEVLRTALFDIQEERAEIKTFLKAVQEADGAQGIIDRLIASAHPGWTEPQVVSHRAAMVGRLRDVGIVDLAPPVPGEEVHIILEPPASEFERALEHRR